MTWWLLWQRDKNGFEHFKSLLILGQARQSGERSCPFDESLRVNVGLDSTYALACLFYVMGKVCVCACVR